MVRKIDPAIKKLSPAERKKYLQNEVALLNKQFGKDMIQFGWDKELQRIPFKSARLNEITSGGVPAGRFNVFWGSKGSCKTTVCYELVARAQEMAQICLWVDLERCIDGDTLIYDYRSHTVKCVGNLAIGDKVMSWDTHKGFIIDEVEKIQCNGLKEVFTIKTQQTGKELNLSSEHRVFTKLGWKKVKELTLDDYLACPKKLTADRNDSTDIDYPMAKLIGYMLGDGCLSVKSTSYSFTSIDNGIVSDLSNIVNNYNCSLNKVDKVHYQIVKNKTKKETRICVNCGAGFEAFPHTGISFCSLKCGVTYNNKNRGNKNSYTKYKKNPTNRETTIKSMFKDLGIHGLIKEKKRIPNKLMDSNNLYTKAACLNGLFSTDGTIKENRYLISFSNLSHIMILQIKSILLEFGIVSYVSSYKQKVNGKDFYDLAIYGKENIQKYYDNIGFTGEKQIKLERIICKKGIKTKRTFEEINSAHSLPMYYNRITSIESIGKKAVYDLRIKNTQNLVLNDLLIHNSFDTKWATAMGVDVKSLLIAPRFDTAEEAMDSVIALTKKKAVDLIVIDSIQGLSPKGEQETKKGIQKSVEDDTMALLARKLSQFFRISSSGVAQSDCTVILIGQTRMDLGGFITLEKLSGGNALEHWSSLTIHFRRGSKANAPAISKKTGKPVKGNSPDSSLSGFELVAKIDKSKVGPDETKEARLHFIYGEGIKDITTEEEDGQQEPDKSNA